MSAFRKIAYTTFTNKCPRCLGGKMFENDNPYVLKNGIKMNETCSACGLKYEREPGFFYGAMYVSYALLSGVFIFWYVLDSLWLNLRTSYLLTIIVLSILLLFPLAYRWSRSIWLNFFVSGKEKSQV